MESPQPQPSFSARWSRGQRFKLSQTGRTAMTAYRERIAAAGGGTRGAFASACAAWAEHFALQPNDGMYLAEAARKAVTLAEVGQSLAVCCQSRTDVLQSMQRLFEAGLLTAVPR